MKIITGKCRNCMKDVEVVSRNGDISLVDCPHCGSRCLAKFVHQEKKHGSI